MLCICFAAGLVHDAGIDAVLPVLDGALSCAASLRSQMLIPLVSMTMSHVDLTLPAPRTGPRFAEPRSMYFAGACQDGSCFWFSQGCQPGCANCTDKMGLVDGGCTTPMEPTVTDPRYRTYMDDPVDGDFTRHHPWRSPGYAPIYSPCGLAGGGKTFNLPNGDMTSGTKVAQGYDGRDPLPYSTPVPTVWRRGAEVEVGWSITANHGGGYAYRLCPKTSSRVEEACFQTHHLSLKGDLSWIQHGNDTSKRTAIPALRLTDGTHPKGSQWTRNPIPACASELGGVGHGFNCSGLPPQFPPPLPGLYGFGKSECFPGRGADCTAEQKARIVAFFNFNIIDKLDVPTSLVSGDYILSFRYDSEQTPQVWANCADIKLVDA